MGTSYSNERRSYLAVCNAELGIPMRLADATKVHIEIEGENAGLHPLHTPKEEVTDQLEEIARRNHELHCSRSDQCETQRDLPLSKPPLLPSHPRKTVARGAPAQKAPLGKGQEDPKWDITEVEKEQEASFEGAQPSFACGSETALGNSRLSPECADGSLREDCNVIVEEQTARIPQVQTTDCSHKLTLTQETPLTASTCNYTSTLPFTLHSSVCGLTLSGPSRNNRFCTTTACVSSTAAQASCKIVATRLSRLNARVSGSTLQLLHYSGYVYRYHPGFSSQFVKRMAEAGDSGFRYYGSNYGVWLAQPLASIAYKDIHAVRRVKVDIPKAKGGAVKFQFEIFMKSHWSSKSSRQMPTRGTGAQVDTGSESITGAESEQVQALEAEVKSKLEPTLTLTQTQTQTQDQIKTKEQTCTRAGGDKKGVVKTARVNTTNKQRVPARIMRRPMQKEQIQRDLEGSGTSAQSREDRTVYTVQNKVFASKELAEHYLKYTRDNAHNIAKVHNVGKVDVHSSKKGIPGLRGPQTWNNRELEWYSAEERMLFATDTKEESEDWVGLLNWCISKPRTQFGSYRGDAISRCAL